MWRSLVAHLTGGEAIAGELDVFAGKNELK